MPTTRRMLLEGAGFAALSTTLPGCAAASLRSSPAPVNAEESAMNPYEAKPLPFDPSGLPGLSERLLRSHHENNYAGAVRKLNDARVQLAAAESTETPGYLLHGLAQAELAFKHSVVLHELYFANLSAGGSQSSVARKQLDQHSEAWERRFRAFGASLGGGSGWVILEWDLHEQAPRMYTAGDHRQGLSSGVPLLVLDMYEHSYHMDYGTAAGEYIEAFFANLNWEAVDRRLEAAKRIAEQGV